MTPSSHPSEAVQEPLHAASTGPAPIHAAVIGAAGYTGGEVLRLLLNHPHIGRITAQSTSQQGKAWHEVHRDLLGVTEQRFVPVLDAAIDSDVSIESDAAPDVVFLCSGHGRSRDLLADLSLPDHTRIIDLSRDFRLSADAADPLSGRTFQYGLPELHRERIRQARNIANPGCFATAIQLALLPLASAGGCGGDIHVSAVTGSTGAGQEPTPTVHHAWRHGNHSVYKAFTHQHLDEILEQLTAASPMRIPANAIEFIPQRGAFTRGILATATTRLAGPMADADTTAMQRLYRDAYADHPFTHLTDTEPDLKAVVNTNACHVHVQVHQGRVLITSVIDNLLKGAAGQAVQNMNLMLGFPETAGLRLKASVY